MSLPDCSAQMQHSELKSRIPSRHFGGKCCFEGFGFALVVVLALGFIVCVVSHEEVPMVSVPLGFEVSGYERRKNWVSENGVFAFGFLDDYYKDDGDSDGFVVGIWYNLGNKVANVPVWTIGGGIRVSKNSTFSLAVDGRMLLFDNPSGVVVWSSTTSNLGVESATLLNNGNLVLIDSGENIVWESFNSPTNTLLPGQTLHFPYSLRAPSTQSISSYYSLVIRPSGDLALVWENNVTYWSSHVSSSVVPREARFEPNGVLGLLDAIGGMLWSRSSVDSRDPSVVLRHLRIDSDGNLRIYSWDSVLRTWKVGWQAVENQCNVFGSCGLYSICLYNPAGSICDCLVKDSLNRGDGGLGTSLVSDSSSDGCKKMVDLGNCKMGAGMSTLKHTVLYGLYPPHDVDMMLNQESCNEYCLSDASCMAATSKNDGSGFCTIKRTGFISGYRDVSVSAVSFLKICMAPEAVSARQFDPHSNVVTKPLESSKGSMYRVYNWKSFIVGVGMIVFVTVSLFLTVEILIVLFIYRRRKTKAQRRISLGKGANPHYSALIRLSYEEVKELTANFKDQLGPTVFKGVLPNQTLVVAKVLDNVVSSERDFRMVVSTLGGTHHRNLVSLKGFCFEQKHKILVYEYIPNGSLEKWLFNGIQDQNKINWQKKLDIAIEVARALAYLHSECQECIAHRNMNLKNVLLDEKLVAKVTNFGVQILLEKENETTFSLESPPERDIYMFGQMLLQILIGKKEIFGESPYNLVQEIYRSGKSDGSEEWEGVHRACRIALWCMQDQPFLRPSIAEVVKVLEGTLSVDRPPPSAAFGKENQTEENDITEVKVTP
ncbi:hypothetical protein GIB67_019721 [Kingdonia uniflora]|uniref:Receptor-like serine/threonine-protein kinase n=1 Tax=Kingdonia uniflora TaxID=39325 RepID=A0A7J7MJV5_9MAGN|nr:hypothetical protein GIB67_019721 [Kingdonia uniflora]